MVRRTMTVGALAAAAGVFSTSCAGGWAEVDTSCATAKADCAEKCGVERAESRTIGPACAFDAVNYVEAHQDALGAETDPQLVHLRVTTYAACSHGSDRACEAHRMVVAAITAKASGGSPAAAPSNASAAATGPMAAPAAPPPTPPRPPSPVEPTTAATSVIGKHGETIAVKDDAEVTITAASGSLLASCSCGQPPYHVAAAFMTQVQDLVAKGDWQGLSAMTNFPLRTPVGVVADARTFVARAPAIFTAPIRASVADAEPRAAFCNAQGFMLGSGVLWGNTDASGHLGVITVNKPVATPAPATATNTETTYCPNGLKANPWHFGCTCGDPTPDGRMPDLQAPSPTKCSAEYPTSDGRSGCVYRCQQSPGHPVFR